MVMFCDCVNSTADSLYGKGRRLHIKLAIVSKSPTQQLYSCAMCYYVRTFAQGKQSGVKAM